MLYVNYNWNSKQLYPCGGTVVYLLLQCNMSFFSTKASKIITTQLCTLCTQLLWEKEKKEVNNQMSGPFNRTIVAYGPFKNIFIWKIFFSFLSKFQEIKYSFPLPSFVINYFIIFCCCFLRFLNSLFFLTFRWTENQTEQQQNKQSLLAR